MVARSRRDHERPRLGVPLRCVLIVAAFALAGCASAAFDSSALIVLPDKYSLSSCKEITDSRTSLTKREGELSDLFAKGGVVFGTMGYGSELATARAELKAVNKAYREKNCDVAPK
jgi:hypothetical protein